MHLLDDASVGSRRLGSELLAVRVTVVHRDWHKATKHAISPPAGWTRFQVGSGSAPAALAGHTARVSGVTETITGPSRCCVRTSLSH